jgi:hypothetical protein
MTEIIVRGYPSRKVEVHIDGETKELVTVLAAAILNDHNFATLVLTTLAFIAEEKSKFPDINLN